MRRSRGHAHQRVIVHAVVAALELQYLVALAIGAGGAERVECRFRAAAGEAHLVGAGDRVHKLLGKQYSLVVVGEEGRAFRNLLADDLVDFRMSMANQHGT